MDGEDFDEEDFDEEYFDEESIINSYYTDNVKKQMEEENEEEIKKTHLDDIDYVKELAEELEEGLKEENEVEVKTRWEEFKDFLHKNGEIIMDIFYHG